MDGEYLAKRIKAAGFSQADIARRMGVSPQSISSMLRYKSVGSDKLEAICRIIEKPINSLYEGYEDNNYIVKTEPASTMGENSQAVNTLLEMLKQKDEGIKELRALYHVLQKKTYSAPALGNEKTTSKAAGQ